MLMLKSLLGVSKEPSNGVGDNGKKGLTHYHPHVHICTVESKSSGAYFFAKVRVHHFCAKVQVHLNLP